MSSDLLHVFNVHMRIFQLKQRVADGRLPAMAAALQDVYEVVANCSARLQDLQVFPWERKEAFTELCSTLEAMVAELNEPTSAESRQQLWPALSAKSDSACEVRNVCLCHQSAMFGLPLAKSGHASKIEPRHSL